MDDYTIKLYNLQNHNIDWDQSDASLVKDISHLNIRLKDLTRCCTNCGSINIVKKTMVIQKINYSIFYDHHTIMFLHKRKFVCKDCGCYFYEANNFAPKNSNISYVTNVLILKLLKDSTVTYSKAAEYSYTSQTYVQKLFDSAVNISRQPLTEVICIDEVYAKRLVSNKFICTFFDPFSKKLIEILDNRYKDTLIDFTSLYSYSKRCQVKYVSIDLWKTYKEVAEKAFPKAIICADSFHVIEHLNKCFDKVRKRVQKRFENKKEDPLSYYWLYKKYFKFLLRDYSKIYDGQIRVRKYPKEMYMYKDEILAYMLKLDSELKLAYQLKEDYREFNQTATVEDAETRLNNLIINFKESSIDEFTSFYKLLKNWKMEIINSFSRYHSYRINNGYIERNNRVIKQIFYNAFGCTNFVRTRNRIMYVVNDDAFINDLNHKKSNKNVGRKRGFYKK